MKLATDKPQYLPGQAADYSIDVTDGNGKPAVGAELSLGVVDEAIYGIRKDTTPDILGFFFQRQWNRVFTADSLSYYFNGEAGRRRMRLAELRPSSRLAQLKPERLVQPKVRKAFPDTAFWAADVTTDRSGHAHAKVEFPGFADHLARHRPRSHAGYQSGRGHAQDHRAQEPDSAAGCAAFLRAGRRGGDFGTGA